jgi:hypothetical protein
LRELGESASWVLRDGEVGGGGAEMGSTCSHPLLLCPTLRSPTSLEEMEVSHHIWSLVLRLNQNRGQIVPPNNVLLTYTLIIQGDFILIDNSIHAYSTPQISSPPPLSSEEQMTQLINEPMNPVDD